MNEWIPLVALSEIVQGRAKHVRVGTRDIALFVSSEDTFHAFPNSCPHRGGPLTEGLIVGDYVYCPLHDWKISLKDGHVAEPDCGRVLPIPVRVDNDMVWIQI